MKGLIIGYGSAGHRHGRQLEEFGIDFQTVDPFNFGDNTHLRELPELKGYDFAVIATPPASHLTYANQCLDADLPVLCEKPLCALGQLNEAKKLLEHSQATKLMVAYNWRYHPGLVEALGLNYKPYLMRCYQSRVIPSWGLLLDHVSHDLDILRMFYPDFTVSEAYYTKREYVEAWTVYGDAVLQEEVTKLEASRVATIYCNGGYVVDLDPNPVMYKNMWQAFLIGHFENSLENAIKTQELLEVCSALSVVK